MNNPGNSSFFLHYLRLFFLDKILEVDLRMMQYKLSYSSAGNGHVINFYRLFSCCLNSRLNRCFGASKM
jgi:hypothetical protein